MKTCFYTIYDKNNESLAVKFRNSLKKFHPDIPLIEFTDKEVNETGIPRPQIFYMSAPYFAKKLMDEGYEHVIKMDCDQLVTGKLDHILQNESYDVGTVLNFNQRDYKQFGQIQVWDIGKEQYINNGFVSLRNKEFVEHWLSLCLRPNINHYQFREQDILNIICYYGNYKVTCFDLSNKWHGLVSKDYWLQATIKDGKLIVPASETLKEEKEIVCLHWAGVFEEKLNYRTQFNEDVIAYLDTLVKE
jgi:hypothetical protein